MSRVLFRAMAVGCAVGLATAGVSGAVSAQPRTQGHVRAFWVSPTGDDGATGTNEAHPVKTLARAQAVVRAAVATGMKGDVHVELAGGTYRLDKPLTFDPRDSGRDGYRVVWEARTGQTPVVSGAQRVTGWQAVNKRSHLWKAYVGTTAASEQLYVNGAPAMRSQRKVDRSKWTPTATGYDVSGVDLSGLTNQSQIEARSLMAWHDYHCPVDHITATSVVMQNPCWSSMWPRGVGSRPEAPDYLYDNLAFVDSPHEWYLDRSTGFLYYESSADERPQTDDIELPRTAKVIDGPATAAAPIDNIEFSGLTFGYTTWMQTETPDGLQQSQGGHYVTEFGGTTESHQIPGAVSFYHSHDVTFRGDAFTHIGSAGLELREGTQYDSVLNSRFTDISASAIYLGDDVDHGYGDDAIVGNTIQDSTIDTVAQQFTGCAGVFVGYATRTTIDHNLVAHVPYTGISVGWGWSNAPSSLADNRITNNRVEDVMRSADRYGEMEDGGFIYTLSNQPGTVISGNYGSHNHLGNGGLYPDEGTSNTLWTDNVVEGSAAWLWMQSAGISGIHATLNNTVSDNWVDTTIGSRVGSSDTSESMTHNTVERTTVVADHKWPASARRVIDNAGPRAGVSVSVTAPTYAQAGKGIQVRARVTNASSASVRDVRVSPRMTDGWAVPSPLRVVRTLAAGQTVSLSWRVRIPADALDRDYGADAYSTVSASWTVSGQPGRPFAEGYARTVFPYSTLAGAFNLGGIARDSHPTEAGYYVNGQAFSQQALASVGLTPGGKVSHDGVDFTWPAQTGGYPNVLAADGQAFSVNAKTHAIAFLGSGVGADEWNSGDVTIVYADGTTDIKELGFSNWTAVDRLAFGSELMATSPYGVTHTGTYTGNGHWNVYYNTVPTDASKVVRYVVMPESYRMRIFAISPVA